MDFHLMACEMAGECFRCSGENSLPIDSKLKVAFVEQVEVLLERIFDLEEKNEEALKLLNDANIVLSSEKPIGWFERLEIWKEEQIEGKKVSLNSMFDNGLFEHTKKEDEELTSSECSYWATCEDFEPESIEMVTGGCPCDEKDVEQPTTGRTVKFKFARMDRVINDFDEEGIIGSLSENPEGNNVYYVHYSGRRGDWVCEERLKLHVNCSNQEKNDE